MSKYFGTDGFRGNANVDLTVEHAYKIGRYLGWYYGQNRKKVKIVIGKDTRRSSYMLEYSLVAGLTASGADAYLMHVTTTPSVAYITRTDDFDCGIMISASHNPYYDNGIKLINSKGHKMEKNIEDLVEDYIDGLVDDVPLATKDDIGCAIDYSSGRNRYLGYLLSIPTRAFKNVKVGLDCANGSSSNLAKSIFDALGAKTYVINNDPNGLNINLNCGSTHIEGLQELVKEKGLDIGFAFDGDADRCLAVDEFGNVVNGDLILYVCGNYLRKKGELEKDTIVTTIMSNYGLYKSCDAIGIKYEKTDVGDKYVNENMIKNNYSLGGEQSGHIIFSKYATTGDGILTALKIMEAVIEQKTTLSKLASEVLVYPQILKNVKVKDKNEVLKDKEVLEIRDRINKELDNKGRILLRASGTEPVVRLMVEAENKKLCEKYINEMLSLIKDKGYLI